MSPSYIYHIFLPLILSTAHLGNTLDCYTCERQENNHEKCLKNIETCEQGQDACLSEISWGSTPYWSPQALKQFYISKRCAKKSECERIRSKLMSSCTHVWYEDWKCSECCQGDKCNFYVILSGSLPHSSIAILTAGVAAVFVIGKMILQ
ncbi:UPAR/Ly6 domain-containing protein cold [Anabrus simplex]|uniref:UPAR/Ly6 domain-containing protein cold n=1 Tax=Anabrus simplex TaxID=316456 RepID=UPI0034DD2591